MCYGINITRFFREAAPIDYSASVAEIGNDAGKATWNAACEDSADYLILDSKEKREVFREFVKASGGWDDEEIVAWSDAELNALCIQWISRDMREPVGFELGPNTSDEEWEEFERQCKYGLCAGRIFKGTDGEIYFDIGS